MNYVEINIGGEIYKLYCGAQATIEIEKALGMSVFKIIGKFVSAKDGEMPDISAEQLLIIFHRLLQKNHSNINLQGAVNLYDLMLDNNDDYENGALMELLMKCIQGLSGGFMTKAAQEKIQVK